MLELVFRDPAIFFYRVFGRDIPILAIVRGSPRFMALMHNCVIHSHMPKGHDMSCVQFLSVCIESREGEIAHNVGRAIALIRDDFQKHGKADVVLLPELFTCGYCALDLWPFAETFGSPVVRDFQALAEELDTIVAWGFAERPVNPPAGDRRVYNSVAVAEPGRPVRSVHKTHLHTSQPGSPTHELDFLLPGEQLGLIDTRVGRLGVMICYDGCFPEVPRVLAVSGADCILWPTRSGGYLAGARFPDIRAYDTVVPIVQAEGSQVGAHSPLPSHTRIVDSVGVLMGECRGEGLLRASFDFDAARKMRQTGIYAWANVRSRRPELYGPLVNR